MPKQKTKATVAPPAPTDQATDALEQTLNQIVQARMAQEGITPELLEAVDLDIAYSPVLAQPFDRYEQAVDVVPTQGRRYLVRHPAITSSVDAAELKIMRLRYLLARDRAMAPVIAPFIPRPRARKGGKHGAVA